MGHPVDTCDRGGEDSFPERRGRLLPGGGEGVGRRVNRDPVDAAPGKPFVASELKVGGSVFNKFQGDILCILIIPPPPSFEIQFFPPTNKFAAGGAFF